MKYQFSAGVLGLLILLACFIQYPASADDPAASPSPTPSTAVSSVPASIEIIHKDVTLWQLIQAGGGTMFLLGLLSVIATAIIIYDFMSLKTELLAPPKFTEELITKLEARDEKTVRSMCASQPNIIAAITLAGLDRRSKGKLVAREAMENAARKEVTKLWQNISYLGDIATIAPLLGLLGTVLGMIQAFNVISYAGSSLKPIMLVGGISKALVTTAAGLLIAIPVLSFYSYFRGRVQDTSDQVETYATDIMKLVEENSNAKNIY